MKTEGNGKLLKIFIGEADKWHGEALYHVIIQKIKENGLAGATTIRGIEGFGANSRVHTKSIEVLSKDLPIVIEVIDKEEKINEIIKIIDPMITEGLMVVMLKKAEHPCFKCLFCHYEARMKEYYSLILRYIQ